MHKNLVDTFSKYESIVLVGGGTGGHIQPIITIAGELTGKRLLWIGGKNSNEQGEALKNNIPFEGISTLKLSTTKSILVLLYPFSLLYGIFESWSLLKKVGRDSCVFSKGGPGSVAIGIAAWILRIPIFIHESDTIPGHSNRILGKIASKIFLGFESAKKYFDPKKCEVVGQILHRVFEKKNQQNTGKIQWKSNKQHILVICGSQGARSIYEAIIIQFAGDDTYEWIISLGKLNTDMKSQFEKIRNLQAIEWLSQEDIASLLSNTDIAITRGSATTLAEIDAFSVKKVIIPLPFASKNHQYWNAREYEKKGDILLEQSHIVHLKTIIVAQLGQSLPPSNT